MAAGACFGLPPAPKGDRVPLTEHNGWVADCIKGVWQYWDGQANKRFFWEFKKDFNSSGAFILTTLTRGGDGQTVTSEEKKGSWEIVMGRVEISWVGDGVDGKYSIAEIDDAEMTLADSFSKAKKHFNKHSGAALTWFR